MQTKSYVFHKSQHLNVVDDECGSMLGPVIWRHRLQAPERVWLSVVKPVSLTAGLPNPLHMPSGPPQFSSIEEMGVGNNRAKRYSSQRQRAVPEPAPPMHLGVMEGHYYEPSKPKIT